MPGLFLKRSFYQLNSAEGEIFMSASNQPPGATAGPSFETTIKPYFTECYRSHMSDPDMVPSPFDLWSSSAFARHWNSIKNAVQNGFMPPSAD